MTFELFDVMCKLYMVEKDLFYLFLSSTTNQHICH